MSKIPTYDAQVSPLASLPGQNPDRVYADPSSFGAGKGLQQMGAGLMEGAETIYDVEQRQEVSDIRTNMAKLRGNLTASFAEQASKAAPGDTQFGEKFMADVTNQVAALGGSAQTRAGRQAFQQESAGLTSDFLAKTTTFTVASAGAKAVADFQTTTNENAGTLFNDPTQFKSIMAGMDANFKDPNGSFANVPPEQKAHLELVAKEQMAIAAARGVIRTNPFTAEKLYNDGNLPGQNLLTEAGNAQVVSHIQTAINGERTKRIQADADFERQQRQAEMQDGNRVFAAAVANPGDANLVPMIVNSHGTFAQKEAMFNFVKTANNAKMEPSGAVSASNTTSLFSRMTLPDNDPQKITDKTQLAAAFTQGNVNRTDFDWLSKKFDDASGPDGNHLMKAQTDFVTRFKQSIDHSNPLQGKFDDSGAAQYYRFTWNVDKQVAQYRQDGKNPYDLFNPDKPDFLGAPGKLQAYQVPFAQSALNVANKFGGKGAPGTTPRKQGESPADYLKRTGGK